MPSSVVPTIRRVSRRLPPPAVFFCLLGFASAQEGAPLNYDDHIRPVLENKCFSCHNPDKKKGGLELTSYAGLIRGGSGGSVVESGDPDGSRLWTCSSRKEEPFMPPEGAPLEAKDLAMLARWIKDGALQSKGGVARPVARVRVDLSFSGPVGRPAGPAARPTDVLLEPVIVTPRATTVTAMAASPWTSLLAVGGQKQVLLYDTDTRELAGVLPYPEGQARSLRFSASGALLILGGGRGGKFGHAVIWDVKTGRRVAEVGKEFDQVMSADLSPDHRRVVLATTTKKVKCFDVASGEALYVLTKHTEWVTAVAFSPDGAMLATADRNGNVFVWEAANGGELHNLGQHRGAVTDLSWRPDSKLLASASADGSISLWELKNGKRVANWSAHDGSVQSVAFVPDGRLVSSGNDRRVAVWSAEGKSLAQSEVQGDLVTKVVALHGAKVGVSANWQGDVSFIELSSGRVLAQVASNPPKLADRRAEAERRLSDVEASLAAARQGFRTAADRLPGLESAVAAAQAAGREYREQQAKAAEARSVVARGAKALAEARTPEAKAALEKAQAGRKEVLLAAEREVARLRPVAEGLSAAEAALAKGRAAAKDAEASVQGRLAESAGLRSRLAWLRAAEFNVGVITEAERLNKLERDIADLVAARAEAVAAKAAAAVRIDASRETIARSEAEVPGLISALQALQAEFSALDRELSPLRLAEAEAAGRVEEQGKFIEAREEAMVRLKQDRDAATGVLNAQVEDVASKHTRPLRARLNELTPRAEAARKVIAERRAAAVRSESELKAAHQALATAEKAVTTQAEAVLAAGAIAKTAAERLAGATAAWEAESGLKAYFSAEQSARKEAAAARLSAARTASDEAMRRLEAERREAPARKDAQASAAASVRLAEERHRAALAAVAQAERESAPLFAEFDAVTKERLGYVTQRDRFSAAVVAAEKECRSKLAVIQAEVAKAREVLPSLGKALEAARSRLAEAARPAEAKRMLVTAAARKLEQARQEQAAAVKAEAAARKEIPQREKNLEDIDRSLAELRPQVQPLQAKVSAAREQYLALRPKSEGTSGN